MGIKNKKEDERGEGRYRDLKIIKELSDEKAEMGIKKY